MKSLFYQIKVDILDTMTIVFSHTSALECARASSVDFLRRSLAPRTFALPERLPNPTDIATAVPFASALSEPCHVMASRSRRPAGSRHVAAHASAAENLPRGSILRIGEAADAFSCSPELFFPQIATIAPRIELIRLGHELCGTYAIANDHPNGFYAREPLTTVARMQAYLERVPGLHGAKAARWALQYVLPLSASPRETTVAMLSALPCQLGGRGLEKPSLNHEVLVTRRVGRIKETKTYRIDLYWPRAKLGLEYDSDLKHTGPARIAKDARRRNDLESIGITMLTATNAHVRSLWVFNKLADVIAGRLGKQVRPRCRNYAERQRELHARLMRNGL